MLFMLFVPILDPFSCSVVTSVILSSNLSNLEEKKLEKNVKNIKSLKKFKTYKQTKKSKILKKKMFYQKKFSSLLNIRNTGFHQSSPVQPNPEKKYLKNLEKS